MLRRVLPRRPARRGSRRRGGERSCRKPPPLGCAAFLGNFDTISIALFSAVPALCLGACRVHVSVLPWFDSGYSSCVSLVAVWVSTHLLRDRGPGLLRSILGHVFGVCVARGVQVCFDWKNMFGVRRCWLGKGYTVIRRGLRGLLPNFTHFARVDGLRYQVSTFLSYTAVTSRCLPCLRSTRNLCFVGDGFTSGSRMRVRQRTQFVRQSSEDLLHFHTFSTLKAVLWSRGRFAHGHYFHMPIVFWQSPVWCLRWLRIEETLDFSGLLLHGHVSVFSVVHASCVSLRIWVISTLVNVKVDLRFRGRLLAFRSHPEIWTFFPHSL